MFSVDLLMFTNERAICVSATEAALIESFSKVANDNTVLVSSVHEWGIFNPISWIARVKVKKVLCLHSIYSMV